MNFDMNRIGRTIARLRRERNMTQMQLADALDVSFQAVSNWERGRSMPDISKLPELAELFSVTIDELLNGRSVIIEKAAYGKLDEHLEELEKAGESISVEEVADAAPILQPKQLEKITDRLMEPVENNDADNMPDMTELLPYVSQEKADMLFRRQMGKDMNRLHEFAPYASEELIDEAVGIMEEQDMPIEKLLPFASQEKVDMLFLRQMEKDMCRLHKYAPFASDELIDEMVMKLEEQGKPVKSLLPFVSDGIIMEILRIRRANGRTVTSLIPFMPHDEIIRVALEMEEKGESIRGFLVSLGSEIIDDIARKRRAEGREYGDLFTFMSKKAIDELVLEDENSGRDISKKVHCVSEKTIKKIIMNRIKNRRSFKELLPFAPEDFLDWLADEAANK